MATRLGCPQRERARRLAGERRHRVQVWRDAAAQLVEALGAIQIRSDVIRKHLFDIDADASSGAALVLPSEVAHVVIRVDDLEDRLAADAADKRVPLSRAAQCVPSSSEHPKGTGSCTLRAALEPTPDLARAVDADVRGAEAALRGRTRRGRTRRLLGRDERAVEAAVLEEWRASYDGSATPADELAGALVVPQGALSPAVAPHEIVSSLVRRTARRPQTRVGRHARPHAS